MGNIRPTREQGAALRQKLKSLQASEQRMRELIDHIPVGVFESTLDGKLLRANHFLVDLLAYPSEERLLEANINHLYFNHEEVLPQIMLTLQRMERLDNVDIRMYRYDGSVLWVSMNLTLLRDEAGHFIVQGMVRDVSTRKQSERALQESEERYQSVVMALVEGVMISDKDDHVLACNPRAMEILGCATHQILGKPPFQGIQLLREDGSELLYEESPSYNALHNGKPHVNYTANFKRGDGMLTWISINAQPLFYPGENKPNGVVTSFQEITDQMITQQQINHQMTVLQTINAIETAGSEAQNEAEFLNKVEGWIRNAFNELWIDFFIFDEENNSLVSLDHANYLPIDSGLIGRATREEQEYIHTYAHDESEEDFAPLHESALSQLCMPIVVEGKLLGILNVESLTNAAIAEDTHSMMAILVRQASTAIERIRSLEDERQRLQQLETLVNISRAMRRAQQSTEILNILVDRTVDVLGASAISVLLEHEQSLKVVWNYGIDHRFHAETVINNPKDPYWQVMFNRQMTTLPNHDEFQQETTNTILHEIRTHSLWSVIMPIKATKRVLGLMHIAFNDQRRKLSRAEREVLTTITEIAGISLHRTQITETLEQRVIERTRSLEMMYNVRRVSAQLLEFNEMLEISLIEVLQGMDTPYGALYLVKPSAETKEKELELSVSQELSEPILQALDSLEYESQILWKDWMLRDPRIIEVKDLLSRPNVPDSIREANLHHFIALPMKTSRELEGVLVLLSHEADAFSSEEINLLQTIATQIMDAVEVNRLRQQAEEGAVVQERQRLARELHDSVTQSLYSLNLMVNAARRFAENDNMERARFFLDQLPDLSQQALKEMRLLIYDLRPSALESEGLYTALSQRIEVVEKRAGVDARLHCDSNLKVQPQVESALYRITIEALNNVLKHASATEADIRIKEEKGAILLEIEDNGKGIDLSLGTHAQGIGMRSMRERTELLGGTFEVLSKRGQDSGTIIQAVIPIN